MCYWGSNCITLLTSWMHSRWKYFLNFDRWFFFDARNSQRRPQQFPMGASSFPSFCVKPLSIWQSLSITSFLWSHFLQTTSTTSQPSHFLKLITISNSIVFVRKSWLKEKFQRCSNQVNDPWFVSYVERALTYVSFSSNGTTLFFDNFSADFNFAIFQIEIVKPMKRLHTVVLC